MNKRNAIAADNFSCNKVDDFEGDYDCEEIEMNLKLMKIENIEKENRNANVNMVLKSYYASDSDDDGESLDWTLLVAKPSIPSISKGRHLDIVELDASSDRLGNDDSSDCDYPEDNHFCVYYDVGVDNHVPSEDDWILPDGDGYTAEQLMEINQMELEYWANDDIEISQAAEPA